MKFARVLMVGLVVSLGVQVCAAAQEGYRLRRSQSESVVETYAAPPAVSPSQFEQAPLSQFQQAPLAQFRQAPLSQFRQAPARPVLPVQQGYSEGGGAFPRSTFATSLNNNELRVLAQRDVIVFIDKSGSMSEEDCPPVFSGGRGMLASAAAAFGARSLRGALISRWEWCAEQSLALARVTSSVLPRGITLVLFDSDDRAYKNVSVNDIPQIFQAQSPGGGTDATGALRKQFDDYFKRKQQDPRTKPLAVAVISDGAPNNPGTLRSVIAAAARKMTRPDEIAVTFLQVGRDHKGTQLLQQLDDQLWMRENIPDIVDSKSFPQVIQSGLARALVQAIVERRN